MGLFTSKEQKAVDAALVELNDFMKADFDDWDRSLKLTIGAKRASEHPIEKIEPVVRQMWVECYARAIVFSAKVEAKYKEIVRRVPTFSNTVSEATFEKLVSQQRREMGGLMGTLVREICEFKPEYKVVLQIHLEEPEMSSLKNEAKEAVQDLLKTIK
jgi:hypothetical protein